MLKRVPYWFDKDIDSAVHELLMKFSKRRGAQVAPPIPVEDIIEKHLEVTLEITNLKEKLGADDVLGAAYFDERLIRVDERLEEQEGRLCFTLAHEVGHWQLHRPLYELEKMSPTLFEAKAQLPSFLCRSKQKPPEEIQADKFAAFLLMPRHFVQNAFVEVVGPAPFLIDGLGARQPDVLVIKNWSDIAKAVITKGNFTNVSVEAMRYRLKDLKLVQDREVAEMQRSLL